MRVRGVVPSYPPLSLVGSWITTHEFLRELVRRGHDVAVTAYQSRGSTWQALDHEGVTVERHFRSIERPDVVVGHAGDDGSARAIAERYGVPWVAMVHGGDPRALRERLAGATLAVFNARWLAEAVDWPGEWIVAHPPIDVPAYRSTPGECVTLVNLAEDKGGALFWALAEALPQVPFLGVVGGYGRQMIYGGLPNVAVQRLTLDMARNVYGRTRLLLMPSRHEAWGRVGIEAGASGIPTVAAELPGIVEALADAATYVRGDRLDDWIAAVTGALSPAEWRRRSAKARRRARQYDSAGQLDHFAAALEDVTRARRRISA